MLAKGFSRVGKTNVTRKGSNIVFSLSLLLGEIINPKFKILVMTDVYFDSNISFAAFQLLFLQICSYHVCCYLALYLKLIMTYIYQPKSSSIPNSLKLLLVHS